MESRRATRRLERVLVRTAAETALHDYPNPDRIGCPDQQILKTLALHRNRISLDDPVVDHVAECSECFRECRRYRKRRTWFLAGLAGVLVLTLAIILATR